MPVPKKSVSAALQSCKPVEIALTAGPARSALLVTLGICVSSRQSEIVCRLKNLGKCRTVERSGLRSRNFHIVEHGMLLKTPRFAPML